MKEGWLKKEGYTVKSWKKRWTVLDKTLLSYYEKENKKKKLGAFSVRDSKVKLDSYKGKKNSFEVVTPARTYHFVATNEREAKSWVEAIEAASGKTKPLPKKPESNSSNGRSQQQTSSQNTAASPSQRKKMTVDDFDLLKVIGKGSFGKVFLVRKKGAKEIFAMKQLHKGTIISNNEVEHTRAEKNILTKLQHPYLITLKYSFQSDDKLYFVMPYINGGELFFHLQKEGKFSEERVRFYVAEIASGLGYLHEKAVIYRDLKPENILITAEGHIILTDFGLSKEGMYDGMRTDTFCGTPEYLAPEVLEGGKYNKSVDWWSLGTLMYEMLCGLPPFYDDDVQKMYIKIVSDPLAFPDHISEEAKDLLVKLLERDTKKRLQEYDDFKAHPFFAPIDWDKLESKKIEPPWRPDVGAEDDIRNISEEFTGEVVTLDNEDDDTDYKVTKKDQKSFANFTYVGGN